MKKTIFLALLTVLTTIGCNRLENGDVSDDICEWTPGIYEKEFTTTAVWITPEFTESTVTIDYSNGRDAISLDALTPKEVAEVAYWIQIATKEYAFENNNTTMIENLPEVMHALKHTHYIVASDREQFTWLYDHKGYENDPEGALEEYSWLAAFIYSNVCYGLPEGVAVSSVYSSHKQLSLYIVSHELTHAIATYALGVASYEHDNPELWLELGEKTVQARAMKLFEDNRP